ncbi:MAG: lipopolysaccharide kinase InaA family protein [Planctomycetota bacterium]|nr:lipopolysaccharide kinase InaA family protein [Planctomycetota bacterium]
MAESELTREVRRRYEVPDGIQLRVDRREVLACLPGYDIAVRGVAAHPDALPASTRGGRRPLTQLESELGTVLVREYRKGGLLRFVRGRRFFGRWRPLMELVLHRRLHAVNVPVTEAVGCVVLRGALGWRGFLLTHEVPRSVDLEAWSYGVPLETGLSSQEVLRRAGRAVRRLHDEGVSHPDLHLKNLLLTSEGKVLVLDLDKAHALDHPLPESARIRDLARMGRGIEKHRMKGLTTGRRESLRFLEGYAGSLDAAHEWLERVRSRLRRGLSLRMAWWRLIGENRPWTGWRAYGDEPPPMLRSRT